MRTRFVVFLITLVSLLAVAVPAMAMEWRESDQAVIGADEVIDDDVLLFGDNVTVDGTVNGDLFAFGGSVVINGTVKGNLITAGGRVEIKGTVTGSVYGSAIDMYVSGRIERTLVIGGCGDISLEPGAYVGYSGVLAGNEVHVNGKIGRGALLGAASVELNGQIGKELKAYVGGLHIGSEAVIEGPVDYTSGGPASIDQGARTGAVAFHQTALFSPRATAVWNLWWRVFRVLGFLLVGLTALSLFPSLRGRYPEIIVVRPWRVPVAGLLVLIVVPVGALLLPLTVIGLPLSVLTMTLFPVLIYLSQVLISWTVGKLLAEKVQAFRNFRWPAVYLMGAFLTAVVTGLPGVGCLFGFIALLYGLGSIYYLMVQRAA